MADHERTIILRALQAAGGSRTAAAMALGIRREYLYARVRALKVDLEKIRWRRS